jgi:hypothetical protein
MTARLKFGIALVLIVAACVSLLLFYLPGHLLWQVDFVNVLVDGRPVQADVFIGHPTGNEAEAFVLVKTQSAGNFLFNLEEENFREVSSREFVRLYRGALTFKLMSEGPWVKPQPFRNMNEFRAVSTNGHTVTVQF